MRRESRHHGLHSPIGHSAKISQLLMQSCSQLAYMPEVPKETLNLELHFPSHPTDSTKRKNKPKSPQDIQKTSSSRKIETPSRSYTYANITPGIKIYKTLLTSKSKTNLLSQM
ncbi:hypothetical protein CDAR_421421 [Caerostris darwini]|uniref:Uncharacterized protein n=1 Tax=Caerostris darwini TaxID=1538125 RepID=A0AAV4SXK2_9ARAC|nr:hypothetical protein CDAR_421421 [Caerostris darwini]